jgi:hypothetical protein
MQAGDVLISGGARGVDAAAEAEAHRCGIAVESLRPNDDLHGRRAPLVRNAEIVTACDLLVGFWDGKSHGTMHACSLARKAGKTVRLFQLPQV